MSQPHFQKPMPGAALPAGFGNCFAILELRGENFTFAL
jgi:hypothetical protein